MCWGGGGTVGSSDDFTSPGTFLYQALKKFNVYVYLYIIKNVSSYTTIHPCDGLQKYDMGYNDYDMIFFLPSYIQNFKYEKISYLLTKIIFFDIFSVTQT